MPKASGFVRFKPPTPGGTWSAVCFADPAYNGMAPGSADRVEINMAPNEIVSFQTYVGGKLSIRGFNGFKMGVPYPFSLEYLAGGLAKATLGGVDLGTHPAPNGELPFKTFNIDYYPNWWDVPEYQIQAAATGIGAALSGVAGYTLKPIDPVISALIGAGFGGGAGYGLAYLATMGIPEIPIPTFGAAPEEPGAPARLGKYQITG